MRTKGAKIGLLSVVMYPMKLVGLMETPSMTTDVSDEDIITKHTSEIRDLITKHDSEIRRMICKHNVVITDMIVKDNAAFKDVADKHSEELKNVIARKDAEISRMKTQCDSTIRELNDIHGMQERIIRNRVQPRNLSTAI